MPPSVSTLYFLQPWNKEPQDLPLFPFWLIHVQMVLSNWCHMFWGWVWAVMWVAWWSWSCQRHHPVGGLIVATLELVCSIVDEWPTSTGSCPKPLETLCSGPCLMVAHKGVVTMLQEGRERDFHVGKSTRPTRRTSSRCLFSTCYQLLILQSGGAKLTKSPKSLYYVIVHHEQ